MIIRDSTGMVDITDKPPVRRTATASGLIRLRRSTIEAIASGRVSKGDVLTTARISAINAVKETPRLIPMCHNIPITGVDTEISLEDSAVRVRVRVTSVGRTGVEMEALTGASVALLTIWDMVKSLEKDEQGCYPDTSIECIRVEEKVKDL
ncbi:MAG: cyclic pyranopterin monophosphate synthase MoaC [Methanothrix sp.]|uniref:cyclic pyranopterin monophosphate synthase MoaC n=1 Tax=Methanothrix sp. TaxID=90426 RepID=UPI0032AF59EA|nr:cyclic pyranopterin monophosphate synthase MoaC [Methanothrix sp.]